MLSVQVNLHTIVKNIVSIKKRMRPNTKFCAVIKANAYSFGAEQIGRFIEPHVDCFAVANLAEGVTLRQAGIKKDILIFGVTEDVTTAIQHNLIITLNSLQFAKDLVKNKLSPRLHLAVNTGMNRFGLNSIHELRAVLQTLPNAKIEGCYTHLAYESDHPAEIDQAMDCFQKFVYIVKKYYPNALIHAGCSGVINYPSAHFDMLRIGKGLYGGTEDTQTAFTVLSKVMAVKKIKAGAKVGYNGEFIASEPMAVGIIAGGYAQGINMNFSGKNVVIIDKQPCPVIGRICMDCFFADVSKVTNPLGKTVTIIDPQPNQNLMATAKRCNLIACNILVHLKP